MTIGVPVGPARRLGAPRFAAWRVASRRRRTAAGSRPPPFPLLAAAAIVALLGLLPIGVTLSRAMQVDVAAAGALLFRPLVGRLLFNTLALVAAGTLTAAVVGTAAAWFVERTRLPGRRIWASLAAVPLAIPSFVTSFAWVSLSPAFQGFPGALLVVTCAYYPLLYLPVAAALRGLDPALEETARSLGCGPWQRFTRVVLPHLRPALFGGMVLVALNVLVEFGAFALLRYRTFTTEIYAEYRTGFAGPQAALLAVVLMMLCVAFLAIESVARGHVRYARVARGTGRVATRYPLGRARLPVLLGFVVLVVVTLGVPLGMILFWLTQPGAAAITPAEVSAGILISSTLSSLEYGAAGASLTMILAFPIAFLAVRYDGPVVAAIERAAWLVQGVPGIVVALALVALTVHTLHPLYQSSLLLVIAYAILFLPLALVSIKASLQQAERRLEDVGRSLGLGWAAVTRRIVLPVAGPGLAAAAAMVFVAVVTDLTTTLLLAPIGTHTLATRVWVDTSTLAFAAAAPFAALMATISLLSTGLLAHRFGGTNRLRNDLTPGARR
ncbi:MAG: iron ABC transporter permease [Azospirillaceae bacterium]|nr:iron ABC transporter permease [Azospirillaceae bacterium]